MRTLFPSLFGWFRKLPSARRTLLVLLALCGGLLIVSWMTRPATHLAGRITPGIASYEGIPSDTQPDADLKAQWQRIKEAPKLIAPMPSGVSNGTVGAPTNDGDYSAPLIAHAAEIAIATKEFAHSRATLEEILDRHHGYAAKLRMVGQPTGGMLTATLRVPSSEFNGTVNDLKTLGSVEREEQSADEVTQQRADLEARLTNAQNTLARLQGLLSNNAKDVNVYEVQRQLASANAEIARLQAERVAAEHRLIFANVLFSLREEITPPAESLGAQFHSAAVSGLSDALSSLAAIAIFVIGHGPVILLWVVIIYFPVRWIWKKWHHSVHQEGGVAHSV